jgi:hypothetical protein
MISPVATPSPATPVMTPAPLIPPWGDRPRLPAVFRSTCAPWDGPALAIAVYRDGRASCDRDDAYYSIVLWRDAAAPPTGRDLVVVEPSEGVPWGELRARTNGRTYDPVDDPHVVLDSLGNELLEGQLRGMVGTRAFHLGFQARPCPGTALCG